MEKIKRMIDRIQNSNINQTQAKQNSKNPSFKGPGILLLRTLNESPAIGACAVDMCSMVIPRTTIEWKNRGPQSGIETGIREGTSNLLHTCVGLIGLGAATGISKQFNKDFNIKAQNIFASGSTIDTMAEIWRRSGGDQKRFLGSFVNRVQGLEGSSWKHISTSARKEITDSLVLLAEKTKQLASATGGDKKSIAKEIKTLKSSIVGRVIKDTGAQASFIIPAPCKTNKAIKASFSELVDNAVVVSNSFTTRTKENLPKFINALKKNKTAATALGMGICALLCMSVQPVNRLLTKLRTGNDGFVGVENNKDVPENKKKFQLYKPLKVALGIAFPAAALRTIGKYSDILSNIQFNSKVPTINQFKFLYGLTIASRFMSARDGNELRESVIKDSLGFTNWLILGGMVSKLVARGIGGKELINNPVAQTGAKKGLKYAGQWLTKASVKSFDEVLLPKAGEIMKGNQLMKFPQLLKNADAATKAKVLKIGASQLAGYLYSGFVLGVGIAKLNIAVTRYLNNKKKAQEQMDYKIEENSQIKTNKAYSKIEKNNPIFKDFN